MNYRNIILTLGILALMTLTACANSPTAAKAQLPPEQPKAEQKVEPQKPLENITIQFPASKRVVTISKGQLQGFTADEWKNFVTFVSIATGPMRFEESIVLRMCETLLPNHCKESSNGK